MPSSWRTALFTTFINNVNYIVYGLLDAGIVGASIKTPRSGQL
jgi:hypothetical protein